MTLIKKIWNHILDKSAVQKRVQILLSYILIIFIVYPVYSQFSIGLLGGTNLATFSGIEPRNGEYESRIGPAAGMAVEYQIGEYVALTFQPMYSVKGTNIVYELAGRRDSTEIYDISADYISIPIGFKIYSKGGNFYALGNFDFGFPLNMTLKHHDDSYDIVDEFKEVDIVATIGMGIKFNVGKSFLFVDFRYGQGLVNFHEEWDDTPYQYKIPSFKTNGAQILLMYMWPLNTD